MAIARIPPARAIASHASGAPSSPSRLNGVVKITGSGFHDGPVVVTRSPCRISRPQMIQAHGSYVGTLGSSRLSVASARQAAISSRQGRTGAAGADGGGAGSARGSVGYEVRRNVPNLEGPEAI